MPKINWFYIYPPPAVWKGGTRGDICEMNKNRQKGSILQKFILKKIKFAKNMPKMDRFYIYLPPAVWKAGTQGVTLRNEQKQGKLLKTSQPNPQRCKLIFRGLKIQKV